MTETETIVRPSVREDVRPKLLPPYAVIVLNDNHHTFEYVIMAFQKVFGYNLEKGKQLATTIHEEGRAIVWSGAKEVAELKKEQIESVGPDIFARKRVDWPLGVELEPLA